MSNMNFASERLKEQIVSKIHLFRAMPVMATKELLEVDLPPVQRKIIRHTFDRSFMVNSASRGIGKTYMAAVQALLVCILIPGSRVLVVGPTFRHAKLIFSEIERILERSAKASIWLKKPPVHLADIWRADFITDSFVVAVPLAAESTSSIRGIRAHIILCDEAPHIPADTFNLVLTPMLSTHREPMMQVRKIEQLKKMIQQGKATKDDLETLN
ncbi:hypothetical protein HY496_00120, partial [Candidatus Woesearchaeota archaeon]|nr:hypothetical protein [Candidatus Woesearchaeota archaeon]